MNPYLSCENIEIKVGYKTLISSFSLTVNSSETFAITGSNGCGKTSLLRILAGLSRPHEGVIKIMNEKLWPTKEIKYEHYSIFLSNIPSLLLDHSVLWNLEFYVKSFGLKFTLPEYKQALSLVGLKDREKQIARSLSTGQKRRLSFAALTLMKPNIVLADEPTNGLDEEGCQLCLEILSSLKTFHNSSIIIATHDEKLINWCQNKISLEKYVPKEQKNKINVKALL
ncbi:heme ABC exporter ATP-binding protein CcmA [Silvanigrella aquatica]|uniref:Heme ABC exporter, ATP-binding protein CcmA n=1 Tax=Silvanigrella aquatica TaxID=1915309 RepID=A0A1L4CXM7_9BACT|nr:heme ABC exporter ATP-binding protein CcmA [Silvanigrella aquatica]APJ02698.1 heme ABC exporter, ATP-binding protein CcmA [Silvanigrella aquatica]